MRQVLDDDGDEALGFSDTAWHIRRVLILQRNKR